MIHFSSSPVLVSAMLAMCWLVVQGQAAESSVVARWEFGTEETSRLTEHGDVHRDQPGPRPPEFPDFDERNTAVKFDGDGAHFSYEADSAERSLAFHNGDRISIEAWVNVETIGKNDYRYIVGKGRTGAKGFSKDNQNWAMRVCGADGLVHLNFLFATEFVPDQTTPDAHWHRWTTTDGFLPGSGWHHLAVTYQFGKPDTIRGWLDGRLREGVWDMGGATTQAPVVDEDAAWIGSSQGGKPANSFKGLIDEVAVHREILSDVAIRSRFRREGPDRPEPQMVETVPSLPPVPQGQVLVLMREGIAAHDRWMNLDDAHSAPTSRWPTSEFFLPRLPYRYDEWGIRAGWKPPVLIQAVADVVLPAGHHRLMMRARGMSRLWLDGQVVAKTKPHGGSSDGHEPVQPVPELPAPGHRAVGFGDQEVIVEIEIPEKRSCRVIVESIAGSKSLRAEPGEMLVAIQLEGNEAFEFLRSAGETTPAPTLIEADFDRVIERSKISLTELDDTTRRQAAASQDEFWSHRHTLARHWVAQNPGPSLPASNEQPIDAFIDQRLELLRSALTDDAQGEARHFHEAVLPVLREHCFRCHGEKVKGGLRLNSRASTLLGGDSGESAIVPFKPDESPLLQRMRASDEGERMPPGADALAADEIGLIENWIRSGATWFEPPVSLQEVTFAPLTDDASFIRRVYLDTIGTSPSEVEVRTFLNDSSAKKRQRAIERLVQDDRAADHWVSYWQDVLAENPNMLKPSLNNSGPFRYFLYESLRDNKPLDRLVTELIMMRGSEREGGSAGFGLAADNDSPMATKGYIVASAFLGVELQCARCHDSPYHTTKQRDLYSLAAMLARKPVSVPPTSSVAPGFFEKNKAREALIQVTLKPGEPVAPEWPFEQSIATAKPNSLPSLVQHLDDSRECLAALITGPENERFAQVVVNRLWRRLIGAGLVEPVHDWEGRIASHPDLLAWLARQFVAHDYDLRHVLRLILNSKVYQRAATGNNLTAPPEKRLFVASDRRRLSAEQVVDSLFASAGRAMEVEEITFDPDGRRPASSMINLGAPSRAWMFASLSNERDRPSLSLPRAQLVTDVLEAFGWVGSRQNPRTDRETEATVLQPGVLANSIVVTWVTRASSGSELARLAIESKSPEDLVDSIFLRFLSRLPTADERLPYALALGEGFARRMVHDQPLPTPEPLPRLGRVSWSNHLAAEANSIKLDMERRARSGSPPDPRLSSQWREIYEDFVWSIVNAPEFVWVP